MRAIPSQRTCQGGRSGKLCHQRPSPHRRGAKWAWQAFRPTSACILSTSEGLQQQACFAHPPSGHRPDRITPASTTAPHLLASYIVERVHRPAWPGWRGAPTWGVKAPAAAKRRPSAARPCLLRRIVATCWGQTDTQADRVPQGMTKHKWQLPRWRTAVIPYNPVASAARAGTLHHPDGRVLRGSNTWHQPRQRATATPAASSASAPPTSAADGGRPTQGQ